MTPTEQDKELRLEIARKVYPKPTPGEIMIWGTPEAVVEMYADSPIVYAFANFITADRKRVALEARIDENRACQGIVGSVWSTSGMLNGMEKRTLEFRQELENL